MSVLRLAIPSPLRRPFDYRPPAGLPESVVNRLRSGIRLRVPFGNREVIGYLLSVEPDTQVPDHNMKSALAILDDAPLIDPVLQQLGNWAARYYHHSLGEVFSALFPKRLRDGKEQQHPGVPSWRLSTRGKGLPNDAFPRAPRQANAIALLQEQPVLAATALKEAGISAAILRGLREKQLIEPCVVEPAHLPVSCAEGLELTEEQATVLAAVTEARPGFICHLVEGVTGSGKTEIYLQLVAQCLQQGRQALILIPEIGLTPQTVARFEQRFRAEIAVLHSGLTDTQRYCAWEAARTGRAHIVLGTRSAVFTPLQDLGLLIVDEEHDNSYKQQDGFRYSARDVAVKRAQLHDCPVLLGSATPSLESIYNTELGRYQHHVLNQRAGNSVLPTIRALDVRRQQLSAGLSEALVTAVDNTLQQGQQALLFLNRRGFAPTLQCHDCGWIGQCHACDARMTVHRRRGHLRCHHCGHTAALPRQCPHCHSGRLSTAGLGTEQTEDWLRSRFPDQPVYRVDSDSMQSRDAMANLAREIDKGEPCILLGTQMLTKGHHFPNVTLVAIIDADALLFSADFRGEERMSQLLTQVAGRAGRAEVPGEVMLQTHYPDHPAVLAMLHSSYAQQARGFLEARKATGMPPAGQLVMVRSDCADAELGEQFLQMLRHQCDRALPPGAALIGPLPSPMQRRAGRYRSQLLLLAPSRHIAQTAASLLVAAAENLPARKGLKWSIDVDPQEVF